METQDKQNIKKKAFVISALMGNDKLANSLFESWDAPVGSTKNTKAKSILYSMKRANDIHDGKGGGTMWDQWTANQNLFQQPTDQTMSSAQNMTPVPEPRPGFQSTQDILDAQQEPKWKVPEAPEVIKGIDWALSPTEVKPGMSHFQEDIIKGTKTAYSYPYKYGKMAEYIAEPAISYVKYPFDLLGYGLHGVGESWKEYTDPERKYKAQYVEPDLPGRKKKYYQREGEQEVYEHGTNKHITEIMARRIPRFWDQVEQIPKVPIAPEKKEYYRIEGSPHVYEKGTNNYISESEAKQRNIKKIETISKDKVISSDFIGPLAAGQIRDPKSQKSSDNIYKQLITSGQDPTAAALEAKWQTGFQPDVDTINRKLEINSQTNPEFGSGTIAGMTPEEIENWYSGLDNSEKDFWGPSYEASNIFTSAKDAYELGLGPSTFAFLRMRDKNKIAEDLGIPKEQAAGLPEGLLSEQLSDLRNSIDKKYKIESQLDKLFDLQQRNLTIEDDFKSYIRGKDEYLGDIDKLLDGAETKIANMDTSNPYVAQRMQMYVNYLTILQGRQNKRYIDFLDAGITKHKNDIDSATNLYDKTIAQANKEYTEIGTVTVESYNMMKTMYEDIYNNIESREDRQIKLEEYNIKKGDAVLDTNYKILRNAKLNAEIYGGSTGIEVNASTAKMFTSMYSAGEDDDGIINFTTYNPYDVQAAATTAGQNDVYAVNSFMKDMGYSVGKSVGSGSLNQFERFKESMIKNVASSVFDINNLTEAEQKEYDKYSPEEKVSLEKINARNSEDLSMMYSKLQNNLQSGLEEYFGSTEEKIGALREAINDLNYKRGWGRELLGWIKKPEREDFVKGHSNIQGKLAGALFDYTMRTVIDGKLSGPRDVWGNVPDDVLPKIVSEKITPYLML